MQLKKVYLDIYSRVVSCISGVGYSLVIVINIYYTSLDSASLWQYKNVLLYVQSLPPLLTELYPKNEICKVLLTNANLGNDWHVSQRGDDRGYISGNGVEENCISSTPPCSGLVKAGLNMDPCRRLQHQRWLNQRT